MDGDNFEATPLERLTLSQLTARQEAKLCAEALERLARAMKIYAAELVTIGDLTVRKP